MFADTFLCLKVITLKGLYPLCVVSNEMRPSQLWISFIFCQEIMNDFKLISKTALYIEWKSRLLES